MKTASQPTKRTASQPTTKRLTSKQRQCLEYVAKGDRPPFKITTVESLARKDLVEHTSLGWRLTADGQHLIAQAREDA